MPINLSNGELLFYNSWNEMIPCGNQSRLTSCIQTSCKYGSGCHHFRSFPPQTLCLGHGFAHQKVPKILEAQTGSRHGESSVHSSCQPGRHRYHYRLPMIAYFDKNIESLAVYQRNKMTKRVKFF